MCTDPSCPIHHPAKQTTRDDGKSKAEQEQRRKDEAIANTTGIRVLSAIGAAVPVRLLKRDLQFLLNQIAPLSDEWRLQILARQHGIRKDRETDAIGKLFAAFVRRSDEDALRGVSSWRRLVPIRLLFCAKQRRHTKSIPTLSPSRCSRTSRQNRRRGRPANRLSRQRQRRRRQLRNSFQI